MIRKLKELAVENDLLQELVDNIPDVIYFKDLKGKLIYVNKAHAAGLGLLPQDVIGKTDYDFFPKELADTFTHDDQYVMRTGEPIVDEIEYTVQPDGSRHVVSTTKYPRKNSHGDIIGLMGITRDVTERALLQEEHDRMRANSEYELKKLKDQIEFEKGKLEQILSIQKELNSIVQLDNLIDFVVDNTAKVLEASRCSLMLVDEENKELVLKGWRGPFTINDKALETFSGDDAISQMAISEGVPMLVRNIENDLRFARENRPSYKSKSFMSVPIKLGNNLIGLINVADKNAADGSVFTSLDLKILNTLAGQVAVAIENARLYKQLNYLTISDPLTNMYNYRHFAKSLDHEIKRMRRYDEDLCLLMIDVDNFKSYNDAYGHLEGDKLLRQLSQLLNTSIREIDIACRYAGDEFVVILPRTNMVKALFVANKLRMKVKKLDLRMPISLSIGIAQCTKTMDRHELTQLADKALYEAKRCGKNRVVCNSN